jgi:hypothetical protein
MFARQQMSKKQRTRISADQEAGLGFKSINLINYETELI